MTAQQPEPQAEYFCVCFICDKAGLCAHREPELVVWWHEMAKSPVIRPVLRLHIVPDHPKPVIVTIPKEIAAPEPKKIVRKPFSRAENLRAGSRYAADYDEARGW